ncbi:MAG: glycosyltransferase family 4 protein [Verrucomicrobiae bacterium]|nr:glycosyltransferase family 4 protein [Verrucomicrobiae bacterium]
MYCGSCLRDNALAAALQRLGLDVSLVPLYTPIRTDEPDVSLDRVFFGGINVWLQQKIPLFRWLPEACDRWLDNPRLIRRVASRAVNVNARELGAMTLSMVRGEHGHQRKEVHRLVAWMKDEARPDLVCLTNLLVGGCLPALKRELPGVPVLVTLQGDDLFLDELDEPWRAKVLAEMKSLAALADGFVVFNDYYRDRMSDLFGIPAEKFHRTALGADVKDFAPLAGERFSSEAEAEAEAKPVTIGYFARRCPEKGYDLLVDAFLDLARRPGFERVRLATGGWLSEKDRPFVEAQDARLESTGLGPRLNPVGSPDTLAGKLDFFRGIDLFCVPARFVEPKGIYALEAMAAGLPVVGPDRGAFPELLATSGGGRLFPAGDAKALADTLADLARDASARRALGRRGHEWVTANGDRAAMARTTAEVFERFLAP